MQVWLINLKLHFNFNIAQSHREALVQSLLSIYSVASTSHQYYVGLSIWTWIRCIWKTSKDRKLNEVLNTNFVHLHDAKSECGSHDLKALHSLLSVSLCIPLRIFFFLRHSFSKLFKDSNLGVGLKFTHTPKEPSFLSDILIAIFSDQYFNRHAFWSVPQPLHYVPSLNKIVTQVQA